MSNYEKIKAKREFKFKEERSEFERYLRESLKSAGLQNYLLIIIAMILLGIFIHDIIGTFFRVIFG